MSKIFSKLIFTVLFIFSISILVYAISSSFKDFLYDYDIFTAQDQPAVVTEKFSKQSLTGMPKYFVTVDLNETNDDNGIENRVFSRQFKQLEVGDPIKGHYIKNDHFFTSLDILMDSIVFLLLIIFLLIVLIVLLVRPVLGLFEKKQGGNHPRAIAAREKRRKQRMKEMKKKQGKKKIKNDWLKRLAPKRWHHLMDRISASQVLLSAVVLIASLLLVGFVLNGFYKLSPFGKTQTVAAVTDQTEVQGRYYSRGNISDPYYALTLEFRDEENTGYQVIKEVTE